MHLVIIGGVAAGTKAAARARRVNRDLKITLFQDEAEVSYTGCGQPYYLSGVVPTREALVIRRAEEFQSEGIAVHLRHRATALDTAKRLVTVDDLEHGRQIAVPYDRLIIATGARALRPDVAGTKLDGVVTLRTMAELDRFRAALEQLKPKQAVIVGSGYIALEVAESLHALGIAVTLLVRKQLVFSRFDAEMAARIQQHLLDQGVQIITGACLESIQGKDGRVTALSTTSGQELASDLLVLAMGAVPNAELAQQAGIRLGPTGAIAVDERMQTSVAEVYAAGDCVESKHRLTGKPVWNPLGDIANLQGRVAGENAAGGDARFPGVFGTAIFKTFDCNVGLTGLTETEARAAGFNVVATVIDTRDKARYYPGAKPVAIKLVAEAGNGRLLGAQVVGVGAVDKMVDIAATALLGHLTCHDLENADLAYAPPFSPVLSPMIVAAGALAKKCGR